MTKKRWHSGGGGEPQVEELLADPIMDLILRCDRITRENVWATIHRVRYDQDQTRAD